MGLNHVKLEDPIAELEARIFPEHVLNLYLPATPALRLRHHVSVFRELAHRYSEQYLDKTSIAVLERERPAITAHLEQAQPALEHGLALFASTPAGFMSSWALPADEEADLRIGTRIHATPLRRQLALHPPSLIVAFDKEKARIFTVLLCDIREVAEFNGEPVKRGRQGGWSSASYQRKEDWKAYSNLKAVARWLSSADGAFFRAIHLAGTPEATSELKALLPARVKARLASDLPAALYHKPSQLIEDFRKRLSS